MKPTYLRIKNWEKFQNKDIFKKSHGRPPWIKFHVSLLDDYELSLLPPATQLTYLKLLLIAAKTSNAVPNDLEWLSNQTGIDRGTILESVALLLEGAWLTQTKSPRRSRTIRESVAQNSPLEENRREVEEKRSKAFTPTHVENLVDISLRGIA